MFGQDDQRTLSGTAQSRPSRAGVDRAWLDLPGVAVLAFDRAFRIVTADGTEHGTNVSFDHSGNGDRLQDRLPPEIYAQLEPRCREVFDGNSANFEIAVGATNYAVCLMPVTTDSDGAAAGMIVFTDVTGLHRAENELEILRRQLDRSHRELQDFISLVSHDLQEPLRKVQALGDRLKSRHTRSLGLEGSDHLRRMNGAIGRMQIFIHDLLAYSRVGTRALTFEQIDLRWCATEALEDLGANLERSGGVVEIGPLGSIEADPAQIREVFKQLFDNALKFHREAEPPIVRVRSAVLGAAYQFEVEDNGIGFEENQLERILAPFKRLHSRNTFDGTGIGLANCRKIIEHHGGSITARSTLDQGSSFIVTLPRE